VSFISIGTARQRTPGGPAPLFQTTQQHNLRTLLNFYQRKFQALPTRYSETVHWPTESYRYHQLTLPTWTHPRGITGPYQILVSLKSDALRWPTDLSAGSWTAVSSGLEKGTSDTRGSRCRGSTTGHPLGEHHHKACPGIGHSKIRLCRFSGVCSWRS
jgi:hypothetical protein